MTKALTVVFWIVVAVFLFFLAVFVVGSINNLWVDAHRPSVLSQTDAVDAVLVDSDALSGVWRITYANGDRELIMCKVVDYACQ